MQRTPIKSVVQKARNASKIGMASSPTRLSLRRSAFSNNFNASSIHFDETISPIRTRRVIPQRKHVHNISSIIFDETISPIRRVVAQRKHDETSAKSSQQESQSNTLDSIVEQSETNGIPNDVTDFTTNFSSWLIKTERRSDDATYSKLQGELLQMVGKYELELKDRVSL